MRAPGGSSENPPRGGFADIYASREESTSPKPRLRGTLSCEPGPPARRVRSLMRHAVLVVLGDHYRSRVRPAGRAVRVSSHLEGAERLLERVVGEQSAHERVAQAQEQLDGLQRLDRADDSREHAEHSGFGAAGCEHATRARRRGANRRRMVIAGGLLVQSIV